MSPTIQTALALCLVAIATGFFAVRWWRGRRKRGCGGGCGCSPSRKSIGS